MCPLHHTVAKTNAEFWAQKVTRNRERDAETDRLLDEAGWRVLRIWEHVAPPEAVELIVEARTESLRRLTD